MSVSNEKENCNKATPTHTTKGKDKEEKEEEPLLLPLNEVQRQPNNQSIYYTATDPPKFLEINSPIYVSALFQFPLLLVYRILLRTFSVFY